MTRVRGVPPRVVPVADRALTVDHASAIRATAVRSSSAGRVKGTRTNESRPPSTAKTDPG
jgi:hypothetical protein